MIDMHKLEIRNLVYEFLISFSTFEYSLKNNEYLESSRDAKPNWTKFINDIEDLLPQTLNSIENDKVKESIEYLVNFPPMKQINIRGKLRYQPEASMDENNIEWQKIVVYLRRIRNNLFHGEKEPFKNERDVILIRNALILLPFFAQKKGKINSSYESRLFEILD